MKCQEFTQKKFLHVANEVFKKAVQDRDIQALEELSLTTRVLRDMNFIKLNIAYTITWNVFNAIEIIKKEKKK
jgi:isopentenyl diphosphate isomerase/L-lactate dehydrogenase-like FMN-dependent dehydrogenase